MKTIKKSLTLDIVLNRIEGYIEILSRKGANDKADTLFILKKIIEPSVVLVKGKSKSPLKS